MKRKNRLDDFPYKMRFENIQIKAVSLSNDELTHIAQASADKLKSLLPTGFDFEANYDILGVAFNAYTPNMGNKNGHMISGEKGIAIAKMFKGKYINIEHERKNVVGCITDYGFSSFPDDSPISEEEATALATAGKVFNVTLAGLIWRAVNPDFADTVADAGDPSSATFGAISASWEVAFKEFNVAKGSKYLTDCEIIDDTTACGALKEKLKTFGGNGHDNDGNPLYLNLVGDTILSMGIGLTETPAAEVVGVTTSDNTIEASTEKNKGKVSTQNVIEEGANATIIMKINKIEDITDESLKSISASALTDFFANKMAETSEEWKKKLDEKEGAATSLSAQIAELQKKFDDLNASKEADAAALATLRSEISAREAEEAFQNRMAAIDADYELTDEDRKIIVDEVKANVTDEAFNAWFEKFKTLAKEKSKVAIAARKTEIDELKKKAVILNANDEDAAKAAKEAADAAAEAAKVAADAAAADAAKAAADAAAAAVAAASAKNDIPNTTSTATSLKDRMAAAFGGENIKITTK